MCANFIICKVWSTITGADNHDGTYTITTKETKPKRFTDVQVLKKSEVKAKYGEYVSLDTFEKRKTESDVKPMSCDTFVKRKMEAAS